MKRRKEGNYWGYMPVNFFAPHHGYATAEGCCACDQHNEFRAMVKSLHAAGIEVILDVVYNPTAEGDQNGPIYSYKGIDNSSYYVISERPDQPYENFSGAGNTLHCANRYVRKLILDSLRYWADEMHVDGFRFDLASVFSRNSDGSINLEDPPLFAEIASDPELAKLRLIAEPWDAVGTDQFGRGFPGLSWFQWNGRFRDDVRRFVRGDPGLVAALMRRLYGSDDLFPDDRMHAYHPYQSMNIDCHDAFTLYDLVSYNQKRNWANGHGNADGPDENHSWNCGFEGDENAPESVMKLRKQQIKNFCCLLFLANGAPMFRAGDEFMQTQSGNNNPYNQDNEMSWLTRPSQQEGREHQSVTSPNRFATKRGLALLLGAALAIAVIWVYWPRKEATPGILEASGRVEGDQAAVGAKIGGRIVRLPIREGDNLKTGDLIAELSSEQTKAQLEQAHHDLHTAREEGDQAEARISVSEREVKARETAVQLAEQESTARIGEAEVNLQTARLPRGQSPSGPHRQPPQLDFSGGAYGRYSLGVSLP